MASIKKIFDEIGHLSLIISLPQLISAPLSVILISLLSPVPTPKDIIEIIDFLVISFPLTIAVALITYMVRTDEGSWIIYVVVMVGASLLSNLLHQFLSSAFPLVDVAGAYRESFTPPDELPGGHGSGYIIKFAMKIISLYWEKFGVVLFLQSCAIGIYAGVRYFNKDT